METDTIKIDFIVQQGWHELTDAQLRYVYNLIALEMSSEEIAVTCLLHWSGTRVIGRQPDGAYLLQQGTNSASRKQRRACSDSAEAQPIAGRSQQLFDVKPLAIAELAGEIRWLADLPKVPVRISSLRRKPALAADFQGVPFETFIICDNLYQGLLAQGLDGLAGLESLEDGLFVELAKQLYPGINPKPSTLNHIAKVNIFYWFASLKEYFSHRFGDFFQPVAGADGNLLGTPNMGAMLQEAMDAQIRALTKGDITKEAEILALDTWRALTELNAQAREYKQLQAQMKK